MTALNTLIADSRATLDELLTLINGEHIRLGFFQETIGPHARHVLDHYDELFEGLATGSVDYDARARDTRTEQDRSFAAHRVRKVQMNLEQLSGQAATTELRVRCSTSPDTDAVECTSTLGRELVFLQSHCIHHLAVIAGMARANGMELHADLGKAPATIAQERLASRT